MLTWFQQWRYKRLVRRAMPTLRALCHGVPDGYHRSMDRLWLDGGDPKGAVACRKLGWAIITHRGTIVGPTAAGRKAYQQANEVLT